MVLWGVYGPAAALSAEDDQVFLDMINQIRAAPYDYAIKYIDGCTHDSLIAKRIGQKTRFEPYTLDTDLSDTAAYESKLMAEEDIPESEKPPVRRRLTASTGGVVSFFNFMPRDTAFEIVINYLLKKELDPDNESPSYILSEKTYSSVGIAISAGKVGSGNAWFVSICFGSPELVSEIQMLNLINQLRANPEKIWEEYTELTQAEVNDWNILSELIYGEYQYNPLFFDPSLSAAAQAHSFYKLNGVYSEEALSQTQTALERAEYYEYEGEVVQEHDLKKLYSSIEQNDRSVYKFFLTWIDKELKDSPPCFAVVFSKDVEDVGYNITFQSAGGSYGYDLSALSFVVGKKTPNTSTDENADSNSGQTSRIYGLLFSDKDGNDLYTPGEEEKCIQQTVTAYNIETQEEIQSAVTDNAGHFFMELPANQQYSFRATIDGVEVRWEGNDGDYLITSDQFVKLVYKPTPPENDLLTVDLQ